MITRIADVRGIGAFDSFVWKGDDLKKYNLIYGWNGSGKTTLSRLFSLLENKEMTPPEYQSVEFIIHTPDGNLKKSDLENHGLSIRVFNETFINSHIQFDSSKAKQILMIGKENIDIKKDLALLEEKKAKLIEERNRLLSGRPKQIKHDQILTEAAREVTKQFGNTPLANDTYYGRNYSRTKIEDLFGNGTLDEKDIDSHVIIDPEVIPGKRELVKQEKGVINIKLKELPDLASFFSSSNEILKTDLNVSVIEELSTDNELSDWVETGYRIHQSRQLSTCQFCLKDIAKERFERLGNFFTTEIEESKKRIDENIKFLISIDLRDKGLAFDSSLLFPDLTRSFLKQKAILEEKGNEIQASLSELASRLERKKASLLVKAAPLEGVSFSPELTSSYNKAVADINMIISAHNNRTKDVKKEAADAAKCIELHTIAKCLIDKEYFRHKKEYEETDQQIGKLDSTLSDLDKGLSAKRGSLKNTAIAAEKINSIIREYFGDGYIFLDIADSQDGYVLKRRNELAKHLSEGEKSVLSLIYFFVKLEEEGCNKGTCIVVVDDPVDSQDSIFLFHTFGLLKRQLASVKQLIIFTHNFDFFNLLRDWFSRPNDSSAGLYQISISTFDGSRRLVIDDLPTLLRDYKSEYQYLFGELFLFTKDKGSLTKPLVPNVSRKILEYFSSFKWVCRTSESFSNIVLGRFVKSSEDRKRGVGDYIYKFIQEYSHGQDFSRAITASMFEAKDIASKTLEFIKLADQDHYDDLMELCRQMLRDVA